jgi:SAM-dependent methyltransferase
MQERQLQSRDSNAGGYDEWFLQHFGFWVDWLQKQVVMNLIDPQMEEVVLDAGCGTGRLTTELARSCKKVYAMDFSAVSIEVLNKKMYEEGINNVQSLVWDITRPYPLEERVDKIVSCGVLHFLPTVRHRHLALQNMYNQLQEDGTLVITIWNWQTVFKKHHWSKDWEGRYGYHCHRFTPDEAKAALQACGFKKIFIKGYANFAYVFEIYRRLRDHRFLGIPYLIARSDLYLSKFNISYYLGDYLVCSAKK